jgi:hypothetical protein
MKKPAAAYKSIILGVSLLLGFFFILTGIGMEEFYEISANALVL